MEIDWFWLTVICAIGGLTITAVMSNYFGYKADKYGCSKGKKDDKKEDKPNE